MNEFLKLEYERCMDLVKYYMVRMLDALGHVVVTFDDLSEGIRDRVLGGEFVLGSWRLFGQMNYSFEVKYQLECGVELEL